MMTLKTSIAGGDGVVPQTLGRPGALETIRLSWGTPSTVRVSDAWDIVAQSDWLPMMMMPELVRPRYRRGRPVLPCQAQTGSAPMPRRQKTRAWRVRVNRRGAPRIGACRPAVQAMLSGIRRLSSQPISSRNISLRASSGVADATDRPRPAQPGPRAITGVRGRDAPLRSSWSLRSRESLSTSMAPVYHEKSSTRKTPGAPAFLRGIHWRLD